LSSFNILENDDWIKKSESKLYDYKLIKSRLEHLRKAREIGDVDNMTYLLRGGLLRNFGGICDRRLFSHAYLGYLFTYIKSYSKKSV
jgi:TAG lipase/lysophosphatidylethanolamine acyltransferase